MRLLSPKEQERRWRRDLPNLDTDVRAVAEYMRQVAQRVGGNLYAAGATLDAGVLIGLLADAIKRNDGHMLAELRATATELAMRDRKPATVVDLVPWKGKADNDA